MSSHPRVLVVGSGWRFTSGISYYTCRLANAFAERVPTAALLVRRLVPRALYPGRRRVGQVVNDLAYDPRVTVLEVLDWYWGPSIAAARRLLEDERPDVVVLQWWTGAVLHTYLLLAALARRQGARVVMEWHEVQDTGEARIPGVTAYVRSTIRGLMTRVDGHVVHSQHDLDLLQAAYGLDVARHPVTVVPHGPYDHVVDRTELAPTRRDEDPFTLLFFGVIRPFKGLEDLVAAFERVAPEHPLRLRIVGETWEGWRAPLDAVAASPVRDRIDVVNRYVTDEEARRYFAEADAVVLPYRRSSASGPLHMAMSAGLPVVVTAVGGLVEAAAGYEGATFVPPRDPTALAEALLDLPAVRGRRYADPHSWDRTIDAYLALLGAVGAPLGDATASPSLTGRNPDDHPTVAPARCARRHAAARRRGCADGRRRPRRRTGRQRGDSARLGVDPGRTFRARVRRRPRRPLPAGRRRGIHHVRGDVAGRGLRGRDELPEARPRTYTVQIRPQGDSTSAAPLLSRSFTVDANTAHTIAVVGDPSSPRLVVLDDDLTRRPAGAARVRVLDASATAQNLTVQAVGGPTLAQGAVLGQVTPYVTVPQGDWNLQLTTGSSAGSQQISVSGGSVYTAVALDSGGQASVKVVTDAAGAAAMPTGGAATGLGGLAAAPSSATGYAPGQASEGLLAVLVVGFSALRILVVTRARRRVATGR